MITQSMKATAISQMRRNMSLEDITEASGISIMILREWQDNLDLSDTVAIEANIHAVDRVSNGELVPLNEDVLLNTLELAAIELGGIIHHSARSGEVIHAQATKLYAEAISKLYASVILKGGLAIKVSDVDNGSGLSSFEGLMKD